MVLTIDVGQLERDIAAAASDLVAMDKAMWAEIIADLRSGHAARGQLARAIAFDDVPHDHPSGRQGMTKIPAPRTVEAATALLDRHAQLSAEIGTIEASRASALAATNAVADNLALPLVDQIVCAIEAALEPWWKKAAAKLTGGTRKSIELGGCVVGTRSGRAKLDFAHGDDSCALATLQGKRWAKPLIRVVTSIDKAEIAKALKATNAARLTALGFTMKPAAETFFIEPIGNDEAKITS